MRQITIPHDLVISLSKQTEGDTIIIPVSVDWPELQLTNSQRLENAIALAKDEKPVHADPSVFVLVLPKFLESQSNA